MSGEAVEQRSLLLGRVIDFYLNESSEFNGLPVRYETNDSEVNVAAALVREGLVQVVSEEDYMNPHIRPWASRRDAESQVASLRGAASVCLYPTPAALADVEPDTPTPGEPYVQRMAKGGGTLELAYFRLDVLESYRNDPRFDFSFNDFGATCSVSADTYDDPDEPEHDKTSISHIGFAYDVSTVDPAADGPIVRAACAFLCDLRDLTGPHQQRWHTYELANPAGQLRPHPVWFSQEMGNWPDGLGPFARFFYELETWGELHRQIYSKPLLKSSDRPREFGWILRPSRSEFDQFVHLMDKLLSENLQHRALDEMGAPKKNEKGESLGTLGRLELFLVRTGVDPVRARNVLDPFRRVRQERQGPAHSLSANVTDKDFIRRQATLLGDVNWALAALRQFWASHPANKDWSPPDYADAPGYWL